MPRKKTEGEGLKCSFCNKSQRDVRKLIAACAERFPGGTFLFDAVPRAMVARSGSGGPTGSGGYRAPRWQWGMNAGEYRKVATASPRIAEVRSLPLPRGRGLFAVAPVSHLLPGALIRNDHRKFNCVDQRLVVENASTAWTSDFEAGQEITVVLKNGEGGFVADERTLDELEGEGRVVFRYAGDNPNGSYRAIAGISNDRGNVVGLMPHPEHNVDPLTGPTQDGRPFFTSVLNFLAAAV